MSARAFVALFLDELRTQLRRSGPYTFALLYAAIGVLIMITIGGAFESVRIGLGGGNLKVDSPVAITILSLTISLFLTMNTAAIAGHAACGDVEDGTHALVYTTPASKWGLLGARFLAALATLCGIALAIPVGLLVGAKLPLLEAERVGSWTILSGAVAWGVWVLPNLLTTSALFFGLAAVTRRMFPNYIGGVALLVGYLGAQGLLADVENEQLAALLDPFGIGAFQWLTQYWSPFESNTLQPWPVGVALANRVGWTLLGGLALVGGISAARLDQFGRAFPTWRRKGAAPVERDDPDAARRPVPAVTRRFDRGARLVQLGALTRRAVGDVLGHRYFWAFISASVLFQLLNSQAIGALYGTDTWPVTWEVLQVLRGTLGLFLLLVLTFYAGDLVWHERDLRAAELYDGTPTPDVLPLLAKATALGAIVVGMHVTVLAVGLLVQLWAGYTHFELGLYVQTLFAWSVLRWLPMVALALAVHAVVNSKWAGHFALVALYVLDDFRDALGFEYNLPWFNTDPGLVYSDLNGWGWFLGPFLVYRSLWVAVGVGLLALARLGWVRGTEASRAVRLREARRRLDRGTRWVLGGSLAVSAAIAGWVVYQTSWLGEYRSSSAEAREQVRYEKEYGPAWSTRPQPRVTAARLWVDLFPQTGTVRASGRLSLENRAGEPISELLVSLPADTVADRIGLDRPFEETTDDALGLRVWKLATPLAPGERAELSFSVHRSRRGWPNQGAETAVVGNGSFVNSGLLVPSLGYDRDAEIGSKSERRKYELPPRTRMRDPSDPLARTRNYVSGDGDWVDLDISVTTDADQVALAPGELVASGVRDGRSWFHYRPLRPVLHYTSVLSGEWAVQRDQWRDVALEVYHHPAHAYNVDRMFQAMKRSLETFSEAFSPFQYKTLRIVEFPRYERFAQSFPSTIPYSEAIGFIARIVDPDEDVDYVYYVTAHEVAHQWWAHQLIGADAQGSTVLSETLAQYSALKVMAAEYGPDQIHRFLKYEADRYFEGRAFEQDREVPLVRVEDQPYIHYNKGGVVMWSLREAVGEARLDAAIRSFLEAHAERGPPYPTGEDFVAHLKQALPEAAEVIADGFERIVLYENRTESAKARRNEDGTWTVDLEITLDQTVADEVGEEKPVPFDQDVEIGVFAGEEPDREVLLLERRRLQGPGATVSVVVPREPTRAGVDPNHLLLDRTRDDNVIAVER